MYSNIVIFFYFLKSQKTGKLPQVKKYCRLHSIDIAYTIKILWVSLVSEFLFVLIFISGFKNHSLINLNKKCILNIESLKMHFKTLF